MEATKQGVTLFTDEKGEPKAFIYFNQDRKRIIYTVKEADEDEIVELLEVKNKNIPNEDRKIN